MHDLLNYMVKKKKKRSTSLRLCDLDIYSDRMFPEDLALFGKV